VPRRFLAVGLLLLLASALRGAQEAPEYPITAEEETAFNFTVSPPQFIKAREAAEAILARQPDSFVALYVLGYVYEWGEANLPRARYFSSRARAVIEARWGAGVPTDGPWRWHARVLRQLISIARQMDREEEALRLLELRDRYYNPELTVDYGWPLMKLGRFAEARAKIAKALASSDVEDRLTALNTLGAMEDEAGNVDESYRVFSQLVGEVRAHNLPMEVTYLRNLGETALELGRYDEAERNLVESTKFFDGETFSNPWEDLSILFMLEGRYPEALSAVREMHAWSHRNPPYLDQQSWADRQAVTAALLAEAGHGEAALSLARRIVDRPDRRGGTSVHRDQSEAGQLLLFWSLARLQAAQLAETQTWAPPLQWLRLAGQRLAIARATWAAGRRAAALTVGRGRLGPSLQFFASKGIDALPWLLPGLVELAGPGAVEAECERLLRRTDASGLRERPFVLLLAGEAQVARGLTGQARQSLEEAQATLPRAEVMLHARIAALLGEVAAADGWRPAALAAYQEALQRHPGVLRALDIALPVIVQSDGSDTARKAAGWLAASPRFESGRWGFGLRIGVAGSRLTATLTTPDGSVLSEARVPVQADAAATARALCEELHQRAFALPLDLSQTDVNSLQGGTLSGESLRRQLSDIIGKP